METISIKDASGVDTAFTVVRQPGANISAVLYANALGGTRTEQPKLELSSRLTNGKMEPVVSLVVPYGVTKDGVFSKTGQVSITLRETQNSDAPQAVIAHAVAWSTNAFKDPQVQALLRSGFVS